MTEQPATSPRRVGGSPAFIAAHGIMNHSDLSFDQAYALTKLILENGGGPVPSRGRRAAIKKPVETALVNLGLIEVQGNSEFTQHFYLQLNIDGHVRELLDAKFAPEVRLTPRLATQRLRWAAVATQAGFDLVATYLPKST
jgi:hypothetical protein